MTDSQKEEQKQFVRAVLAETGLSIEQVAAHLGCKPATAKKILWADIRLTEFNRDSLQKLRMNYSNGRPKFRVNYSNSPRGKLQMALDDAGLTPAQLAKRIGYDIGPVQAAVVGAGMSESMARAIELLKIGLTAEELLSGSDYPLVVRDDGMEATYGTRPKLTLPEGMQGRYVPLLSYAQAGAWDASHSDALYDHTAIFALNVDDRRAFAIKVTGNSMEPSLPEGDIVICSPGAELRNGEAAVIRTRSEQVFIKFWEKRGERVTLSSANPDYDPIHLPLAEIAGAWAVVQHIASGKVKKE